eukprot:scaffold440754_cov31-Prasinocladus_malaysianus.AAC.1
MKWFALPFGDHETKAKLSKQYEVNGIPTLVMLDGNAEVITTDGRAGVSANSFIENFPYHPKP